MSLIQAALDKTGKGKTAKVEKPSPAPPPPAPPKMAAVKSPEKELSAGELKTALRQPVTVKPKSDPLFKILAAACGVLVIALAVIYVLFMNQQSRPVDSPVTSTSQLTAAPMIQAAEVLMDQALPPAAPKISHSDYQLNGITMVEGQRMALINNEIVRAGDVLKKGNAVVQEVLSKSVTLRTKSRTVRLSL